MPTITKSANYKVDLQRSKEEILELKSLADESESNEGTIIASVIDWLFDNDAEYPLVTITDDDDEEEPDIEDFDDEDDDGEEFDDEDLEEEG